MHYILSMLFLIILTVENSSATSWTLIWEDDFTNADDGFPDTSKWNYEKGFLRNQELQYYTEARSENARIENGVLILEGRKERYPNANYQPGSTDWRYRTDSANYTSTSLTTKNKFSFKRGRIEILAQVPPGNGTWPAFWTLGITGGWPLCGEIDVMEYVGKEPNVIFGTIHWANGGGGHTSVGGQIRYQYPHTGFHLYAVEWFADRIDWYFDSTKYYTTSIVPPVLYPNGAFDHEHYILLNLALGGTWGGPLDDSKLPAQYKIKYVKVYSQSSTATETSIPSGGLMLQCDLKPSVSGVDIRYNTIEKIRIRVVNISGSTLYSGEVIGTGTRVLETRYMPSGLYLVSLTNRAGKKILRLPIVR